MTTSVRSAVANRLGKSGVLSLKKDVFGVYNNDNPQSRSLLSQMELIQTKPLIRVAQVTIIGETPPTPPNQMPRLQRDLDNANVIYQRNPVGAWIYCTGSITRTRPQLVVLDQDDCSSPVHSVSAEEDQLFDLGRDLGANIVGYYIVTSSLANVGGCGTHPPGRRGFWLGRAPGPGSPLVAFAHELTHVLGHPQHVTTPPNNLMTQAINKPVTSTLTEAQATTILNDPDMEYP
jgi:hypothetical protein